MQRPSHIFWATICCLAGANGAALAATPSAKVEACLQSAAAKHAVSYQLLRAIAEQESSFNPKAGLGKHASVNTNGTRDYGLMQINSTWLPMLSQYGITMDNIFDPCVNADVGAWILSNNFQRLGFTWNAVGAYNAKTQWKRVKYASAVYEKVATSINRSTAQ